VIVLLREDATTEALEELRKALEELGLFMMPLDERKGSGFEVIGRDRGRVLELRDSPAIEEILTRRHRLTGGEPIWPHFVLRVSILVFVLFLVVGLLTAFFAPGLGDRALTEGAELPQHPEWHLRPLEGFIERIPMAGTLFLLAWIVFIFWPFLDRTDRNTPSGRRIARLVRWLGILFAAFLVALGLWGAP